MTKKLKVGVIGGGIGRDHIASLNRLPTQFEVGAFCDIDEAKATKLAEEYVIPRVTTRVADLYAMDDLDIIDICTPSHLHHRQTLEALAAGKHVFCEKPVAGSLKQVDELIKAESQSGKRVLPIFQYRFGLGLQKLKWLVDQGVAGRAYLTTSETAWRRRARYYAVPWRGKWETELGGTLVTHAIHAHDAACYILGAVKSVAAHVTTRVNPVETDDVATATLQMADGSLCSFASTTGAANNITRQRYCFSQLTAESNLRPYAFTGDEWTFLGHTPEDNERIQEALSRFEPLPEGNTGEFYRFARALETGSELPVTLADARAALELITAMYCSARTKQVVELPISNDHPMYGGWQPSKA